MAIINKTGIGEGNLINAEHITRIIDALSSQASTEIVATGSFTGSFDGIHTGSFSGDGSGLINIPAVTGPGGTDKQIQFNNLNTLDGVPTLTYNGSILSATGSFTGSLKGILTGTSSWSTKSTEATTANYAAYTDTLGNDTGSFVMVSFNDKAGVTTSSMDNLLNYSNRDGTILLHTDIVGVWDDGLGNYENIAGTLDASVYSSISGLGLTILGSPTQVKYHNFSAAVPEFKYNIRNFGPPFNLDYISLDVSGKSTGTVRWKAVTTLTTVYW